MTVFWAIQTGVEGRGKASPEQPAAGQTRAAPDIASDDKPANTGFLIQFICAAPGYSLFVGTYNIACHY
jgi:hypothetical protein